MNTNLVIPSQALLDEIAQTPHALHFVKDVPSSKWMDFKLGFVESMREIFHPVHEIPLRVDCSLVETEQITLKLICELYEALNSDKDLAYRLSPEYRQDYVAIYTPLKNKMKYIVKRGNSVKRQQEQGRTTELTGNLEAEVKIALPPLTGSAAASSQQVIRDAARAIAEWEKHYEHATEQVPEPLDLSDAVNLLCRLLEVLEDKQLLFYYGNWKFLKGQFWKDLTGGKWGATFTDVRHILSQYFGTRRRSLSDRLKEVGTRRVRPVFLIYIDQSSMDSQISRKQLEALAANSKALYMVYVQ
ncbi:MAG: hypothetical protein HYZ25_20080 [Chloroflexi bacterium]|nr:hypothetical protein [Chloroflexota bacterium]